MTGTCEDCAYNVYDDEMDEYVCEAYLDEDEFYRVQTRGGACPYYRSTTMSLYDIRTKERYRL